MSKTIDEQVQNIEKHYTDLGEKHAEVIRAIMRAEGKDPVDEDEMIRFARENRQREGIKEALTEIKRLMEEKWTKIREIRDKTADAADS